MPDAIKRLCPICRDTEIELEPYRFGSLSIKSSPVAMMEGYLETEIYLCPRCRYAALFVPPSPAEAFEKQQQLQDSMTPVEKFEYTFRHYSEKQLQKVIDGRDYVSDAKKAAKNLLYRRRYGE